MRNLLKEVAKTRGRELHAKDYLDDGSPIELKVTIDEQAGSAVFDFEGTGNEMIGMIEGSHIAPDPLSDSRARYKVI